MHPHLRSLLPHLSHVDSARSSAQLHHTLNYATIGKRHVRGQRFPLISMYNIHIFFSTQRDIRPAPGCTIFTEWKSISNTCCSISRAGNDKDDEPSLPLLFSQVKQFERGGGRISPGIIHGIYSQCENTIFSDVKSITCTRKIPMPFIQGCSNETNGRHMASETATHTQKQKRRNEDLR